MSKDRFWLQENDEGLYEIRMWDNEPPEEFYVATAHSYASGVAIIDHLDGLQVRDDLLRRALPMLEVAHEFDGVESLITDIEAVLGGEEE